jgi:hypothetical protein
MSWRWATTSFSRWDNSNTTSFLLLMSVYNFLALDGNPNQWFEHHIVWKCLFRTNLCWCQFRSIQIVGTTRFGKKVQMGVIMVKLIDHEESFSKSSSNGLLGPIATLWIW